MIEHRTFDKGPQPILPRAVLPPGVRAVIADVCLKHGVSRDQVLSRYRGTDEVVQCRMEICYKLRQRGASYPLIGQYIGRDHTSVLNSVRRWSELTGATPVSPEALIRQVGAWTEKDIRKAGRLWALGVSPTVIIKRLDFEHSLKALRLVARIKGWGPHPAKVFA